MTSFKDLDCARAIRACRQRSNRRAARVLNETFAEGRRVIVYDMSAVIDQLHRDRRANVTPEAVAFDIIYEHRAKSGRSLRYPGSSPHH